MSCFNSNCYLPQPPRAWSRVQNSCSLTTDVDNNGLVKDPYTGQLVTAVVLADRIAMLSKGNVLQYKANSSNLTKAQRYSKIAKGQWVNRNTTWATQSTRGYTNPNTTSLKRTGNVVNIAIDPITGAIIGPTSAPQTCPTPVNPIYNGLPSNGGGGSDVKDPDIPPPVEPTPGSNTNPPIISDTPVDPIVIQDGGVLICTVQENPCTGETKSTVNQKCYPTTDSDVPGPIQDLCWNDGMQTWYPRSRYFMTNSTNKWPVNANLAGAIQIYAPYITSVTSNGEIVTLIWNFNNVCLPASNFNIYQDGILIRIVDGNTFTIQVIVSNCKYYQYYIVAENITAKVISEPSNSVGINLEPSTNLYYTTTGSGTIELYWGLPNSNCKPIISYNIYQDSTYIGNTTLLNYTINGLTVCNTYTYFITLIDNNGNESSESNSITFQLLWPGPPVSPNIQGITVSNSGVNVILDWFEPTINVCTNSIITYNLYFNGGQVASNITDLTYTFTGINFGDNNTYGVQSSAIINGITQTSIIVSISYIAIPFTVAGSPIITNPGINQFIIQYTSVGSGNSINFSIQPTNFSYIVVGGGGGGGAGAGSTSGGDSGGGGGGGGGQVISANFSPAINTTYNITVGDGGPGCYLLTNNQPEEYAGGQSPTYTWGNGELSSFDIYVASGGYSGQGAVYTDGNYNYDRSGAPLGGAIGGGQGAFSNPGTGYQYAVSGSNGTTFNIYTLTYTFGGGGGGGSGYNFPPVLGGIGGGGSGGCGGDPPRVACIAGTSNTGGGGGGGGCFANNTNYSYSTLGTASTRNGGSGTVVLYFDYN